MHMPDVQGTTLISWYLHVLGWCGRTEVNDTSLAKTEQVQIFEKENLDFRSHTIIWNYLP